MSDEAALIEEVHFLVADLTAPAALRVIDAVRSDFLEWGSETGTLKGGENMRTITDAQATAAAVQGIGPAYMLLREAGIEVSLWNSGGWTMILTVPLRFPGTDRIAGEIWVTAYDDEPDKFLTFDVARKRARYLVENGEPVLDEMADDSECVSKDTDNLVEYVRRLIDLFEPNDGIEQQWVDTNDLSSGWPRVLSFDECAMRGLDGTGRNS